MQTLRVVRRFSTSAAVRVVAPHYTKHPQEPVTHKTSPQSMYGSWRLHVAKTTAQNIKINDKPRYETFTHPGLTYAALDKYGNPDIVKVNELFHDVMFCSMKIATIKEGKPTTFLNLRKLMQNNKLFISELEINAQRHFYNKTVPKWPLDAKITFGGFGRTSLLLLTDLSPRGGHEPFVSRTMKSICVDSETLKPVPYPAWLQDEFKGCEGVVKDIQFRGFKRPEHTYRYRVRVVEADTDMYNHTSYAPYFRFGLSALHSAMAENAGRRPIDHEKPFNITIGEQKPDINKPKRFWDSWLGSVKTEHASPKSTASPRGDENIPARTRSDPTAVKGLNRDIVSQGVKHVRACYRQESHEGDELDVYIWQDIGEPMAYRCSVERPNGKICAQFLMEFFRPAHQG